MKAVFQRLGAVAWGHSVAGLLEELAQKLPVPEALLDAASELDKAYIPSRYPDALPEGAPFSATGGARPSAFWDTRRRCMPTVKVFYPRWTRRSSSSASRRA